MATAAEAGKKIACEYVLKNGCPPEKAVELLTEDDATIAVTKAATYKQEMHG